MPTVNFQCGHCGNLMGVTDNLLGQQVRCPHCQQVVVAPAAAAPPPLELPPTFVVPPSVEPESIFSPPEDADDDLFGETPLPQVEMPAEPAPWLQPPPQPMELSPAPIVPPVEATLTYAPPQEPTAPATQATPLETAFTGLSGTAPAAPLEPAQVSETGSDELLHTGPSPAVARATRGGGGWIVPVLIIPLISYSILVTVLLAMALLKPPPPDPLERLPDQGMNPGASRINQKTSMHLNFHDMPLLALPRYLRVPLGKSLTIGDLKVTPRKAELHRIRYLVPGAQPEESPNECLCVYLELENISQDVVFRPMDPLFNRKWVSKFEQNVPFTYLEMGARKFYGGPCEGTPPNNYEPRSVRAEGQNLDKELKPGEKMRTFVCTNPDDADSVGAALANYRGPLLYRVRLRRGLVPFRGREVSATAVIGIEFSSDEVVHGTESSALNEKG